MLIADKYEVRFEISKHNGKTMVINMILPKNLKNEGIIDQLLANTLKDNIIDDFPLF